MHSRGRFTDCLKSWDGKKGYDMVGSDDVTRVHLSDTSEAESTER